jgi:hypothetical protein
MDHWKANDRPIIYDVSYLAEIWGFEDEIHDFTRFRILP